jgi:hypothetical protein
MIPAASYAVELLCRRAPGLSRATLHEALVEHCGVVVPESGVQADDVFVFSHAHVPAHLEDPALVAQTMVVLKPGAQSPVLEGVAFTVLVTDLMSASLPPLQRLRLFIRALQGVLSVVPCVGIHWLASQRIVLPHDWLGACRSGNEWEQLAAGPVDVRTFPESDGDRWMDSLGLFAFGLPDVQLRYRGLDVEEARGLLGEAVLENISGAKPVELVDAFAEPHRPVVQLHAPRKSQPLFS